MSQCICNESKTNYRIWVLLVVLPLSLLISLEYQQHGAEYRPTAMRLKVMVICKETIWSRASSVLLTPQSTMESYKIVVNQRLSRARPPTPHDVFSNIFKSLRQIEHLFHHCLHCSSEEETSVQFPIFHPFGSMSESLRHLSYPKSPIVISLSLKYLFSTFRFFIF